MSFELQPELIEAIQDRRPIEVVGTIAYITEGGTYMLASPGHWNDSGEPHDLLAILWNREVQVMRPTVNPEFTKAVKMAVQV